jgi:hypothetical protein
MGPGDGSANPKIRLIRWKMYEAWSKRNGCGSLRDLMASRLGVRSRESPSRLTDHLPFPTPCLFLVDSSKRYKAPPLIWLRSRQRHVEAVTELHQSPLLSDHLAPHCASATFCIAPNPLYRHLYRDLLNSCVSHHIRWWQCSGCRRLLLWMQWQYRIRAEHRRCQGTPHVPATCHLLLPDCDQSRLYKHCCRGGAFVLVREDA